MSVVNKLSSALDSRDEAANIELAKEIVQNNDVQSINELVALLDSKNKALQHDSIKVLYEIGELKPGLISSHFSKFIQLLESPNNRLQWGAMTALSTITMLNVDLMYQTLPRLSNFAEKGSVITRDKYVAILVKLAESKRYNDEVFALLNEQLLHCPANQLPMYAENSVSIVREKNKAEFAKTLTSRLGDFEKESKRKRVEKILKKLN